MEVPAASVFLRSSAGTGRVFELLLCMVRVRECRRVLTHLTKAEMGYDL